MIVLNFNVIITRMVSISEINKIYLVFDWQTLSLRVKFKSLTIGYKLKTLSFVKYCCQHYPLLILLVCFHFVTFRLAKKDKNCYSWLFWKIIWTETDVPKILEYFANWVNNGNLPNFAHYYLGKFIFVNKNFANQSHWDAKTI